MSNPTPAPALPRPAGEGIYPAASLPLPQGGGGSGWGWARRPGATSAIEAALILGVLLLSVAPLLRLLWAGVAPVGTLDPAALLQTVATPRTWVATLHSLVVSFGGAALALVIGTVLALLTGLTDLGGKAPVVLLFSLLLLLPPQVTATAWLELFGPQSVVLRPLGLAPAIGAPHPLQGWGGITLLLGLEYAPLVFLTARTALRDLPRELVEAAQAAGAGRWTILRTVTLPLLRPALAAGTALAFVSGLGNFGTPALLGIPAGYGVLTTLIYQRLAGFGPRILGDLAGLSLVLALLAAIGAGLGWLATRNGRGRFSPGGQPPDPIPLGRWTRPVQVVLWLFLVVVLVLPLVALIASALVPAYGVALTAANATLANLRFIVMEHAPTGRALFNSTLLSAGAALILGAESLLIGYFAVLRRRRVIRALALLAEFPYALPGVALAIAMILLLLRPLPLVGSLYNTIWILLVAYLSRFLVLALRPVMATYAGLDPALEEAAMAAGAPFVYRLRTVLLPLVLPAILAGAMLVFMTALNELTLSALLWSSGNETLGIVVFSLEQAGELPLASALSLVAVMAVLLLMGLATGLQHLLPTRLRRRGILPWQA